MDHVRKGTVSCEDTERKRRDYPTPFLFLAAWRDSLDRRRYVGIVRFLLPFTPEENTMKKIVTFTVPLFFWFAFVVNADEVRIWTSANGKHKTEAKLVDISKDGKTITLLKADNKEIDVALEKLSKADQAYVNKQQKGKDAKEEGEKEKKNVDQYWDETRERTALAQVARKEEHLERAKQDVQSLQQRALALREQGAAHTSQLKQLYAEKVERIRNCRQCGGTRTIETRERCNDCNATGRSTANCGRCKGSGRTPDHKGVCSSCRGNGADECSLCRGTGTRTVTKHCDCGCTEIDLAGMRIQGELQSVSNALQMNQRALQKAQSTLRRNQSELQRAQNASDQLNQGKK